jgi:DNA-binding response OmpR family regulator
VKYRPRILVVQYVPLCSDLPARLRAQGASVHMAADEGEAIELVRIMPFDLVVLLVDDGSDAGALQQQLRLMRSKPLIVCLTTESARLTFTEKDADLIVRSEPDNEPRFPAIAMEAASDHLRLRLEH